MAYEDRVTPQQSQSNYYEPPQSPRARAQAGSFSSAATTPAMPNGQFPRSRASTDTQNGDYPYESSRYSQARQPINDAVTSAFHTNDPSVANISPDILNHLTSKITADVLNYLKTANLNPQTIHNPSIPLDSGSSAAGSPPMGRAALYTPPSPYRGSEEPIQVQSQPQSQAQPQGQPPSSYAPPKTNRSEPSEEKRPTSPFSQGSHASRAEDSDAKEERACRPPAPKRDSTEGDTTLLEKVWGILFNDQGEATPRLGQFLRGIAMHLIEDYEPKGSLVITPLKMQRYYEETKLPNEIYPWQVVFDDRTSSISRMFRDLEAQHHLVQDHRLAERPDIPGLTPLGFERWMTLVLKAHPDQEFERLASTALNMPINNPDVKAERFPKLISRRLFPKDADTSFQTQIQKAMEVHCSVNINARGSTSSTSDAKSSATARNGDTPATSSNLSQSKSNEKRESIITPVQSRDGGPPTYIATENQPKPPSKPPSEVAVEDEDNAPTPHPIERERKPYVAQPGGGKTHNNLDSRSSYNDGMLGAPDNKSVRSPSVSSTNDRTRDRPRPPPPISIHQTEIPESKVHRRNSRYHRDPAPRSGRTRSPISQEGSFSRRSEYEPPPSSYGSSYHSTGSVDYTDEPRKYRDFDSPRDRHDSIRMPPPERGDRDSRPRGYSTTGYDPGRGSYPAEEDFHRRQYVPDRDGHLGYSPNTNYPSSAPRDIR